MKFNISVSNGQGNEKNCFYPHRIEVTNREQFEALLQYDQVLATFDKNYRSNVNFISGNAVVMDCDNAHSDVPEEWVTPESVASMLPNVQLIITSSRHHMMDKGSKAARPRFHAYFPCSEITDAGLYAQLKASIYQAYPFFDGNCLDASRFIFGCDSKVLVWQDGGVLIDSFLAGQNVIAEGSRNSTLSRLGARMVKRWGVSEKAREEFIKAAATCSPPLPDAEVEKIWGSVCKFGKRVTSQEGYVPPDQYQKKPESSLKPDDFSDIGQATVLSRECGNLLRYHQATGYITYDGTCWVESDPRAIGVVEELTDRQLAEAQTILMEAEKALKDAGDAGKERAEAVFERAKMYLSYVMQRRNMRFIKSAMDAAKPMLHVEYKALDADPFLLNTPEATYDLRQGVVGKRDHDCEDLITKVTTTETGNKGKELWEKTLSKTFVDDQQVINYVQQIVGLAAIGRVYIEMLVIAYGEGRNGKSTFFNTIARVLGSYSGGLSADALTIGCKRNTKWEMTELKGKRLVIAAELEEGTRLNTAIVKQLCSTDEIMGERKYKDPAPFAPSHTCVLYTNHLPRVGALDAGTWRRLVVIPFTAVFAGNGDHKNYADYLVQEAGPAVLSWIIEGAQKVIANNYRLETPDIVQAAIEAYRQENDWLNNFLRESCEMDASFKEKAGELYLEYRAYCERVGEFTRSAAEFSKALLGAGFEKKRTKAGIFFTGMRIKSEFLE